MLGQTSEAQKRGPEILKSVGLETASLVRGARQSVIMRRSRVTAKNVWQWDPRFLWSRKRALMRACGIRSVI